jgi:hypothetical protein
MMTTPTPQVVTSYLLQLEAALRDVEPGVRDEIVAGIREELQGLDAAAAATRIEELGDPEFIAAEARAASPGSMPQTAPPVNSPAEPGHGYALFAAVFMMVGSIVIPILGGVVGLGLVLQSRAWSKRERLVALAIPVLTALVLFAVSALVAAAGNYGFSGIFTAYIVLAVVFVVEGFVLMARGYGRNWRR